MKRFIQLIFIVIVVNGSPAKGNVIVENELYDIVSWEFVSDSFVNVSSDVGVTWHPIDVPHKWPNQQISSFGYGTYKVTLKIKDKSDLIAVVLPNVLSSYVLYSGNTIIAKAGQPSPDRDSEVMQIDRAIHLIPDSLFNARNEITLYLQVSNHQYHIGGLLRPVKIGSVASIITWQNDQIFTEAVQAGALGVMGLFLLMIFLFRRSEFYILYFSLLSFGMMARILHTGQMIGFTILPDFNGISLMKFVLVSFYLGITFHFVLLSGIFPNEFKSTIKRIVWVIGICLSAFILLTPLYIGSFSMPYFQIYSLLLSIYLIICVFKAAKNNRKGAKTILVGGFVAFLFLINDILYNLQYIDTGDYMGWGAIIYIFLLTVVISRRFSVAMDNEEDLLIQFAQLNKTLENQVMERTKMLERNRKNIEFEAKTAIEKNKELLKTQEEEHTVTKTMVHDLKAPFNKILGLAQIIRMNNQYKGQEEKELNEMILRIAEEGRMLIDDLNVLTMYEVHVNDNRSFKETNINKLLQDSVTSHGSYASSKEIHINYHGHHQVISYINPNMLSRIVDNLLSNAIKFSPVGSIVSVELIRRTAEYEIVVTDQGPGFSEQDKGKMFGKFQKLSARPTQGESSTGLGLSIVKNLTDLMSGTINVTSLEGSGAKFILVFPMKSEIKKS